MPDLVSLVHRLGDALTLGEVPEFVAPDVRFENTKTAVTDKTYVGFEGIRDWRRDLFEAFADGARLAVDEVVAEGEDYVVAIVSCSGRGAASGAPLNLRWVTVLYFRDGRLTRSANFVSRREALEAVGQAP
jgi:ketosteroid isomerase-like protein